MAGFACHKAADRFTLPRRDDAVSLNQTKETTEKYRLQTREVIPWPMTEFRITLMTITKDMWIRAKPISNAKALMNTWAAIRESMSRDNRKDGVR